MRFLTGADIQTQVRRIASRTGEVMAAVAYWGSGAAERTGLTEHARPENVRIICDLRSGACNPSEIETLMQRGLTVRMLHNLHAKVWIGGNDVIVGSANASQNGLPGADEHGANANIEAAVLSQDPRLARELRAWFHIQWCASCKIEDRHLDQARLLWERRQRAGGRGFTPTLIEKIRKPGPLDRFSELRLIAYLHQHASPEAEKFVTANARRCYTDDEWEDFGAEHPWYECTLGTPEWSHKPGTVFADFSCSTQGGKFTFNDFWQIRDCPSIPLETIRVTLLTKLPRSNGYSLPRQEQAAISRQIRETVAQCSHRADKFGSYIDKTFLEFWDRERAELRQQLVAQVVEAARELCRTGQFVPSLTLRAIRVCKEDPEWLNGYTRFVGGGIYQQGNRLKRQINPNFGQLVKSGVGANDQEDERGQPVTEKVEGEIIQRYTLFRDYDPTTVETP